MRLIDLFVGSLSLADLGFKTDFIENGMPAYHTADLLRLFIYGYLNRVRSSRQLQKDNEEPSRCRHDLYCIQPAQDIQYCRSECAQSLLQGVLLFFTPYYRLF